MTNHPYFRRNFFTRRTDANDPDPRPLQPNLPLTGPEYEPTAAPGPVERPRSKALVNSEPVRRSGPIAPSNIPTLLSGKALALKLGISHRTLERMRVEGGKDPLPYHKLGGGKRSPVRYNEAEVTAWLSRHRRTSTSDRG